MTRARRIAVIDSPIFDRPMFQTAISKAVWPISYRIQQIHDGKLWTSTESFTATSHNDAWRAVVAGFMFGEARWAIDRDGLILCGMDGQGNRYLFPEWPARGHSNLESIRAWHADRGMVWS